MRVILGELAEWARTDLQDEFLDEHWPDILARFGDGALGAALTRWAEADPRPLVLLIDEIDSLIGDTLLAVLRQLRPGATRRPEPKEISPAPSCNHSNGSGSLPRKHGTRSHSRCPWPDLRSTLMFVISRTTMLPCAPH